MKRTTKTRTLGTELPPDLKTRARAAGVDVHAVAQRAADAHGHPSDRVVRRAIMRAVEAAERRRKRS
ncbi:hypothetical protein [Streptomyces sp. GbtcB6]|uniref:hypothetical protein n=1 Tax=Streptomyces sp. GbtcB6 TaxID=2824751 RepID=UPI001C30110D|nr:hypothetical protein [Streptomyces sp. GbtcB6]